MTYYILPTNLNEQGEVVSLRFVEDGQNELVVDERYEKEIIKFAENFVLPKEISVVRFSENQRLRELPDLSNYPQIQEVYVRFCGILGIINDLPASIKALDLVYKVQSGLTFSIRALPDLSYCRKLETISLVGCGSFREIGRLPESLRKLKIHSSDLLQRLDLSQTNLEIIDVHDCENIATISLPETLKTLRIKSSNSSRISYTKLPDLSRIELEELIITAQCRNFNEAIQALPASLKVLEIAGANSVKTLTRLPLQLRKLNISQCQDLEVIKIPNSLESLVIAGAKKLKRIGDLSKSGIVELKLSGCQKLERIDALPNSLENLRLAGLSLLRTIPDLSKARLKELNISNCKKLRRIRALSTSLKTLELKDLPSLEEIPDLVRLRQLERLSLSSLAILTTLPDLPPTLAKLDLSGCDNLTMLPDLSGTQIEELLLSGCKELATLPAFPATLAKLDLSGCNKLTTIPDLSQTQIIELNLSSCKELATLPALPPTLAKLDLRGCEKLTTLPDLSQTQITGLNLSSCKELATLPALPPTLAKLYLRGCNKLTTIPDLSRTQITELDLSYCEALTTIPDLSQTQITELNLSDCEELTTIVALPSKLTRLNLGVCKLTTLPDLSQTQITELDLSGCQNITALPAFPMTLRRLDLRGCVNLRPTPELIARLRDLENQNLAQGGCTVIYPAGFFRDSLISENRAKLQEAIAQFNQVNPEFPRPTAILTLFERFISEGGQRVQGEAAIRQVVATISDAVDFIEKNPQSLSWIEEIASLYAREGCVNQPVAGWMEISALANISSGQTVLDKLNTACHLLSLDAVKVFYSKHCQKVLEPIKQRLLEAQPRRYQNNQRLLENDTRQQAQAQRLLPGAGIEVEFGNVLMREVHKMLLQNGDITKRWPGIPETIYAERSISSFLTPEIVKQAYDNVKAQIFSKSQEELAQTIISSQHLQAWGDIALKEEVARFKEEQKRQDIFTEKQFIAIILGGNYGDVKEKPEDYFDNLFAIYKAKPPFRERSDDGVSNEIWQAIVQDFVEYKAKKEIEFAQIQQPNPPQNFTRFLELRLRLIDTLETQEVEQFVEKTTFKAIFDEKERPKFLASHKEKSQQLLELIKEFDKNKLKKVPPTLGSKVAAEVSTASAFPSARPQAAADSTSASDSTRPRRKLPQLPARSSSTASASQNPQAAVQNPRNAENLNQERYQEK